MRQLISLPFENIHLQLRPSKQIAIIQTLFFGALSYVILKLSLPLFGKSILLVITAAIFIAEIRRHALLLSPTSISHITLSQDKLTMTHVNGTNESAPLMPYSLISPRLTILAVKHVKQSLPKIVYLTDDNSPEIAYRRLRVFLSLRGKKLLPSHSSKTEKPHR